MRSNLSDWLSHKTTAILEFDTTVLKMQFRWMLKIIWLHRGYWDLLFGRRLFRSHSELQEPENVSVVLQLGCWLCLSCLVLSFLLIQPVSGSVGISILVGKSGLVAVCQSEFQHRPKQNESRQGYFYRYLMDHGRIKSVIKLEAYLTQIMRHKVGHVTRTAVAQIERSCIIT